MSENIHISCPHCLATNRLPHDRLQRMPRCGQCKQDLFNGKPMEINTKNVQAVLNNNNIPVLVDCWAPWCGPCRQFAPVFEQAARELEPAIRLAKLNTDTEQGIAVQWHIQSIPTLILFRDGRESGRTSGAMPLASLKQWLQKMHAI